MENYPKDCAFIHFTPRKIFQIAKESGDKIKETQETQKETETIKTEKDIKIKEEKDQEAKINDSGSTAEQLQNIVVDKYTFLVVLVMISRILSQRTRKS